LAPRAGVRSTCDDLHSIIEIAYRSRRETIRSGSIAELSVEVFAPTYDAAALAPRACMLRTKRQLGRII
jgi:hypothetical protein